MFWVFLAISANLIWAFVAIGDKYIISKKMKDPYVYMVWFAMTGALMSSLLLFFIDFSFPSFSVFLWLALSGVLYFYGGLPYIRALQIEEPTRINIWWNLIPVHSLIVGWLFFQESFNLHQLIAFIFLVTGAFVASIHSKRRKFKLLKALLLMIVASLAYAFYAVVFHHAVKSVSFLSAFVLIQFLMFGFSLTLFVSRGFRKSFRKELKRLDQNLTGLVFGMSFLDNFGMLLNQWALVFGTAALVFAFEGSQTLFVFVIATLLSVFSPKIIKEELDKKNILLKVVALVLIIVGVLVLNLG